VRDSSGSSIGVSAIAFDQPNAFGMAPFVTASVANLEAGHASQVWGDDGLIKVDAEL